MKIIPLSEGAFTVDQTKRFVPFDLAKDNLLERSRGSLLVEIQPFIVITSDEVLLLDTGLGFTTPDGKMQIHNILAQHGILPEDVNRVLMSHLHKDHSGGIMMPDKKTSAFKNATYYISRQEWELALTPTSSYHPEDFKELSGEQLRFVEGSGSISNSIEYIFTGAHSPYHQAFKITEGDEVIFYGGDVAPRMMQMKNRYKAKYDYRPEEAMLLRQQWMEESKKDNRTFLFYHDIKYPYYQFKRWT
ncbi:MAG: MBL fold metallo-hydrolase [Chitinophagaceae bacterium]|nr:MBL fold metallo-hydrolase [Chitinophagaceae bacterium]